MRTPLNWVNRTGALMLPTVRPSLTGWSLAYARKWVASRLRTAGETN